MLRPLNINLLTGLVLAIILLGAVSAVTVFLNAQAYRELAFDYQRQYMTQLIAAAANDILADNAELTRRMGLNIQNGREFRAAFDSADARTLAAVLEEQYHRAPVTSSIVAAVSLYVFDSRYELLAASVRNVELSTANDIICPSLVTKAKLRTGTRRLKPLDEMCLYRGHPYQAVIVPVGGLSPEGYLQVVSDPLDALTKIGTVLKMPIQIRKADGSVTYSDSGWGDGDPGNTVSSSFVLVANNARPALEVTAVRNADVLVQQIQTTNQRLLVVVALVLMICVSLALLMVKYSVFRPLELLSTQIRERWGSGTEHTGSGRRSEKQQPVSFHALGELYETLHDMAIRDPLTGIYNRALLEDRLTQVIAEHRRRPSQAAVLLFDMVRFKYVNDMLGHHVGDELLKQVVQRVSDVLRESDTLARLGGDEFVVVLPDTDAEQAVQVAQKIIKSMRREFEIHDHKLSSAVSIGISLMPEHGEDVERLLRSADYAMYLAKASREGYAIYDPSAIDEINIARRTLDGVLTEDLDRNDLFLAYQPVIGFADGEVYYLEALVRWRQPDGKILLPEMFIRAAEQSGLIRQLSEWVIETACRELKQLHGRHPDMRTGINLSMHNLHDLNLANRISQSLERNNLDSRSLLLEITETGVMLDPDQVNEMLEHLSGMGLKLSIDDFGTGHSSLVYLKRLPVHTLKVDKSFVGGMDRDEEDASIVRATIDLAHSLGLTVTAEGVESQSVFDLLAQMGCDYCQGYYIGKPMTLPEIRVWLDAKAGRRIRVAD